MSFEKRIEFVFPETGKHFRYENVIKMSLQWMDDLRRWYEKGNMLLFRKDSEILSPLSKSLDSVSHKVAIRWALGLTEGSVILLEDRYPNESRPRTALESAVDWTLGRIGMGEARRSFLNCHSFAKELSSREDIAICHAVAQACSVVHTKAHSLGYPMYDLTSLVHRHGVDGCEQLIVNRVDEYIDLLTSLRPTLT